MASISDSLFGPLLGAVQGYQRREADRRREEENRRRYEEGLRRQQEQFDYRKLQDLKREADTVRSRISELSPEEISGQVGQYWSERLHQLEGGKEEGVAAPAPFVTPQQVDPGAFAQAETPGVSNLLEDFIKRSGAQTAATARGYQRPHVGMPKLMSGDRPETQVDDMGPHSALAQRPSSVDRLSVPDAPADWQTGPHPYMAPGVDTVSGLENIRDIREGEKRDRLVEEQKRSLDALRMLEDMEHLGGDLARLQELSRQRRAQEKFADARAIGAEQVAQATDERNMADYSRRAQEALDREAIEGAPERFLEKVDPDGKRRLQGEEVVRQALLSRGAAQRDMRQKEATLEAEKRMSEMEALRELQGIEPVEMRPAYRFAAGQKEAKLETRARKEFNEIRDTLTKGLINYGAHGEAMIVALHKYEKEEMTLKDLKDHWKRAIAEVDTKNQKEIDRQFKLYMRKLRAANRYKRGSGGPKLSSANRRSIENRYVAMSRSGAGSEAFESQLKSLINMAKRTKNWIPGASGMSDSELREAVLADFQGHVATVRAKAEASGVPRLRAELTLALRANQQALARTKKGLRSEQRRAIRDLQGQPSTSPGFSNRYKELLAEEKMLISEILERPSLSTVHDPTTGRVSPPPVAPSPVGPEGDLSGATPEELGALQSLPKPRPAPDTPAPAQPAPPAPVAAKPKAAADRIGRIPPEGLSMRGMSSVQDAIQGAGGGAVSRRKRNMAKTLVELATRDDREINEDTVVRHYEQWGLDSALLTQEVDKAGGPTGRRTVGRLAEAANSLRRMIKRLKAIEEKDRNAKIQMTNGKPIEVWIVLKAIESGDEVKALKTLQSISVGR